MVVPKRMRLHIVVTTIIQSHMQPRAKEIFLGTWALLERVAEYQGLILVHLNRAQLVEQLLLLGGMLLSISQMARHQVSL